jgi:NADPH:quinone reductase-like Zn-dependent oxidoreductase
MKAFVIDAFRTAGVLRDQSEPPAGDYGIRVAVHVAGVNPIDWKIRDGEAGPRRFPLVLGQDFAGLVEAVSGTPHAQIGERVYGIARANGGYAEKTALPNAAQDSPYARLPDELSDAVAAALPTPGLTALASLAVLNVAANTRLLIVGAAGAVGRTALQVASHSGAAVTAVVRPGQAAQIRGCGAKDVVEAAGDAGAALGKDHAGAFEAVLDLVSDGETLKANVSLVRPGGKLVTTVHVADEAWFAERGITATNIVMNKTPQSSQRGLDELARLVISGVVSIDAPTERPLRDAGAVLDGLKARTLSGKFVLRIAP